MILLKIFAVRVFIGRGRTINVGVVVQDVSTKPGLVLGDFGSSSWASVG
jgi:hypothetical protein